MGISGVVKLQVFYRINRLHGVILALSFIKNGLTEIMHEEELRLPQQQPEYK